jgi:TctA family transporter
MDLLNNLALGFGVAFTFQNLAYAFGGAILGTLIGVLPGLGPVATIAMLLPSIYSLDATPALIMLAGIYYGAQYGGSTTAILINVPGESSSVVTAIDGYQMARRGRAGAALAAAGPSPGSTPISVPRMQPISAKTRFCQLMAAARPVIRCCRVSTANPQIPSAPIGSGTLSQ